MQYTPYSKIFLFKTLKKLFSEFTNNYNNYKNKKIGENKKQCGKGSNYYLSLS